MLQETVQLGWVTTDGLHRSLHRCQSRQPRAEAPVKKKNRFCTQGPKRRRLWTPNGLDPRELKARTQSVQRDPANESEELRSRHVTVTVTPHICYRPNAEFSQAICWHEFANKTSLQTRSRVCWGGWAPIAHLLLSDLHVPSDGSGEPARAWSLAWDMVAADPCNGFQPG